ncbi:MAG: hypothetical protein CMQ20_06315 [Gammaproteobacteria bacterium]|nr:hypothetical protein [Gammaproteobacteria bacterium]
MATVGKSLNQLPQIIKPMVPAVGGWVSLPKQSSAAPSAWREGAAIGPAGALNQGRAAGTAASSGGRETQPPTAHQLRQFNRQ